jgi:D-beta-D-heptose 7-phosphate kinase/D-beta-D-heptose 1-phosphate adenosyltransferase
VRALKGPTRPIVPEDERARVLAALGCVDAVVVFDEHTPLALIERLRPDVLVKGADYEGKVVVGREVVEAGGGEVVLAPFREGFSTTTLLARIQRLTV